MSSADDPPRAADRPDEAALWRALKDEGSATARQALFDLYVPYARRIARRHFLRRSVSHVELSELRQLAFAGLLEAIDGFDPERGPSFRAYAVRRISGSVLDGMAAMSEMAQQLASRHRLRQERVRSLREGADEAASSEQAIRALADLAVDLALGFMIEGSGLVAKEDQADPAASAYESLAWKQTLTQVLREVAALGERDQTIIRQHYLNGLTFEQIGHLLGISKGRVSQLHRAAIASLRGRLPNAAEFHLER